MIGLALGSPRVLVARPYATALRGRVWDLLRQAGLDMEGPEIIPSKTSDDEAVAQIVASSPDVLVIPFNAHHGDDGQLLDGLMLCGRLFATPEAPLAPVLMPVSHMAAASLRLRTTSGEYAATYRELLETRILVLDNEAIEDPHTPSRVAEHLRAHGVSVRAAKP